MIIIKKNKHAFIVSLITSLTVLVIGSLVFIEIYFKEHKNSSQDVVKTPNSIVYFYSNKGVSQIFDYSLASKQSKLLYTDDGSEYKITNIANYNTATNSVILAQARSGFNPERLTKLDLSTGKSTVVNDSINYLNINTDSTGSQYSGILKNETDYKLISNNVSTGEILNIKTLASKPINLIYLPNSTSWIYKGEKSDLQIYGESSAVINNTPESVGALYNANGIIFNRGMDLFIYNLISKKEESLTNIKQTPTSLFNYKDCFAYTYEDDTSDTNAKLICKDKTTDLDFTATNILAINYEN